MTRIDRYLLFLYLRVLVICLVSMCGLIIVVQRRRARHEASAGPSLAKA